MFANTYVGKQDDSKAAAAAASIACSTHHEYDSIFSRKHLVFNRHESPYFLGQVSCFAYNFWFPN